MQERSFRAANCFPPPLARNAPPELLAAEKRNAANDPADYFEYVMLSWGNCQAGDRLVTERRLGRFPDGDDLSIGFAPAVRFYFRYDELAKHPNCCFEGVLPMKIKDAIILSEWVYAVVIPEGLRHELQDAVPPELQPKIRYVANDCKDIWEWSEKVYGIIEY